MLVLRSPPLELVERFKPGTAPCNAWLTLATGRDSITSEPTILTAPVTFTFFCVPYPTTTTSSKTFVSSLKIIFNGTPVHFISCVWYPTNEMTIVLPLGTLDREKSPSIPVMVPFVEPFTTTDAPIIVSPVASFTTPVQVPFCWVTLTSVFLPSWLA